MKLKFELMSIVQVNFLIKINQINMMQINMITINKDNLYNNWFYKW